jgi:hypothetical protein
MVTEPPDELGRTFEADSRSFFDHFDRSSRAMDQIHRDCLLTNSKLDDLKKLNRKKLNFEKKRLSCNSRGFITRGSLSSNKSKSFPYFKGRVEEHKV